MKNTFIILTGCFLLLATSCSSSEPSDNNSETPNKEENIKPLDTPPMRVTWEQLKSSELEKGQIVIVKGFIGTLSDRDYSATDLKYIPLLSRRNESSSFVVDIKMEYGQSGNHKIILDDEYFSWGLRNNAAVNEYYHTDIRIITNTGGTAVISTHVEVNRHL